MSFSFRPAVRENVPLLIGIAGGTGSGKSFSALRIATGLANGKKFAAIDTENGRIRHYADQFNFDVADLHAPFRPDSYVEAIEAADKAGYPVIVVDSASHEYTGVGGLLDWHEELLDKMAGTDWKKREVLTFAAWVKPKTSHKQLVSRLLQVRAHVILCFRASEKIEIVKDASGKTVVRPKKSLTGLDGWMPETEKNLPYELTLSFLVTAYEPGVPRPIKMQEQFKPFVPLDAPLSEETGRLLAEWARGADKSPAGEPLTPSASGDGPRHPSPAPAGDTISQAKVTRLWTIVRERGVAEDTLRAILSEVADVSSSKAIPVAAYDKVIAAIEAAPVPESQFRAPAGAA